MTTLHLKSPSPFSLPPTLFPEEKMKNSVQMFSECVQIMGQRTSSITSVTLLCGFFLSGMYNRAVNSSRYVLWRNVTPRKKRLEESALAPGSLHCYHLKCMPGLLLNVVKVTLTHILWPENKYPGMHWMSIENRLRSASSLKLGWVYSTNNHFLSQG